MVSLYLKQMHMIQKKRKKDEKKAVTVVSYEPSPLHLW